MGPHFPLLRIVFLLAMIPAASSVGAQDRQSAVPVRPLSAPLASHEDITARRVELEKELAETKKLIEAATDGQYTEAIQQLTAQQELLEKIDILSSQYLTALRHTTEVTQAAHEIEDRLTAHRTSGFPRPPPYPLALLDGLYDELDSVTARAAASQEARQAATAALEQAQNLRKERERARRQARETLERNSDPAAVRHLQLRLRTHQLESRVAATLVQLRELEAQNEKHTVTAHSQHEKLLHEQLAWVEERLGLTPQALAERFTQLEKQETDIRNAIGKAERQMSAAEGRLSSAQKRLDATPDPQPAAVEELEAFRLDRQLNHRTVTRLNKQLERRAAAHAIWQRRYDTRGGQTIRADLRTWEQEATQALEGIEREHRLANIRIAELRENLTTLRAKLETARATSAPTVRWLHEQEGALQGILNVHETDLADLDTARRLHRRLLTEIHAQEETATLTERLQGFLETARTVWRYELIAVDDRSLTVGTVAAALLLFILGIIFSRFLSNVLGHRLLPRFGLDPGAATAFQTLTFYFLVTFFTLFALRTLNVPLTLFTFLGGALAIGVGFGSQNILNNFISGLILLAERPIRVGDMVDVDGTYGAVERIGLRSTRVRLFTNIHIIVPNSLFLEKNVPTGPFPMIWSGFTLVSASPMARQHARSLV